MRASREATCESLAQHSGRSLLARLVKWLSRTPREERNRLTDLTDEQLKDIGVDPRLLARSAVSEAERISLLDLYWPQQSRPPRRR